MGFFLPRVLLLSSVARKQQHTRASTRVWDFSTSHRVSQVPWPIDQSPPDSSAHFDVNGPVVCLFPGGKRVEQRVNLVTFSRDKDELRSVTFALEKQNVDNAHATAVKLARYWDVDTAPLEQWYAEARDALSNHPNGKALWAETRRNRGTPHVSIEIFTANDSERPYWISLQISRFRGNL